MGNEKKSDYFPIRVLSEMTGVGSPTLRAWERRYGLLKPVRTPKGHRLYTREDALLVGRVVALLNDGHTVGEVARRLAAETEQGVEATPEAQMGTEWESYLQRLLDAVEAFSPRRLEAVYNQATSLYPLDLVSRRLVEPVLQVLGGRWTNRPTGVAEEHFFTAWLRNKLGARLHHASSAANGSTLLCACVPGHVHEIGVLLFALAALGRGYRVVYLGPDMPLEPIPAVAAKCAARAVVLAGGREKNPEHTLSALARLAPELGRPLFVGGPIATAQAEALSASGVVPIGEQLSLALHLVEAKVPVHPSRTWSTEGERE